MFSRTVRIFAIALLGGCLSLASAASHKKSTKSTKSQKTLKSQKSQKAVQKKVLKHAVRKRVPAKPASPRSLMVQSASFLVLDQQTGKVLTEKHPDQVLPIASITKLMTSMVVLDAHLDPHERIEILQGDTDQLRHSRSRLPVGTMLSRREALTLALMASENRAARALGRTYPGGMNALVAAMNAKAKALGLNSTRFEDPAGLSAGNVSSAWDLARLVSAAQAYPEIRESSTRDEAEIRSGRRSLQFINTNRLVRAHKWQIGLSKTGFIDEAGRCLVMQAQVNRRPVIIVLLDSQGAATRFADAMRIKTWFEGPGAIRS